MQEELISLYQSDNRLMNDAVDRLVVKLYAYKEQYQKSTFLLTGCGSANGTTTVAINLAIALAGADWNTLLVDADMRKGVEYKRLNTNAAGLSDYLEGNGDLDSVICQTDHKNLHYVQYGSSKANAVRLLSSERMQQFVSGVRDRFDFIVFDCPSITVVPDAMVLFPTVDCIALVLELGGATKKQLVRAKREVAKYADKYAGIIVNRVDKRQYIRAFPQYDYFEEDNMRKSHKRSLKRNGK